MKKLIIAFFILFSKTSFSQYSNYYNINSNSNLNINANINQNVSGNIYEHKTITTIDYGALNLANAQNEKNRLEQQKFLDEKQKQIAMEISESPLKSFDYGTLFTISSTEKKKWEKGTLQKMRELIGFDEFKIDYVVPNFLLFNQLNAYKLQNVSLDGVNTDILIFLPFYNKDNQKIDIEEDFEHLVVGKEIEEPDDQNKIRKIFYHKKELNRATVYGNKGYRTTIAWEDKFENGITDNYSYYSENIGNGYKISVKIRYYGNKSEVDFEKLEGRRYYLKPLIEKIVSTARVNNLKVLK